MRTLTYLLAQFFQRVSHLFGRAGLWMESWYYDLTEARKT